MRKYIFTCLATILLDVTSYAQLSGPLNGVITSGTYTVIGNISVQAGDSLTIEPDVVFEFTGDYTFGISGYLHAAGTENDSIKFQPSHPDSVWGGIDIGDSADDSSRLEHCFITGSYDHGIRFSYSSPVIANCTISGNTAEYGGPNDYGGGISCYYNAGPIISNCDINGNWAVKGGGISCYINSSPVIAYCTISGNSAGDGGGIYVEHSSPVIVNCTISGNTVNGSGGAFNICYYAHPNSVNNIIWDNSAGQIYVDEFSTISCTYSDVQDGWAGMGNIDADPLFYAMTGDSAFYLTSGSPCIDAGNPVSPPDPDSTIADMGAFYYHHAAPPAIILTPFNPPIIIPPGGGNFTYNIAGVNNTGSPVTYDILVNIEIPGGNQFTVMGPIYNLTLFPVSSIERDRIVFVPGNAPPGEYFCHVYVGTYPWNLIDMDSFSFFKEGGGGDWQGSSGWYYSGELFPGEDVFAGEAQPVKFALLGAFPNPFNASTAISFQLLAVRHVNLTIYDITGREVARLVDGMKTAGSHQVVFDARDLSSGVYFARLEAGEFRHTRKILLVK